MSNLYSLPADGAYEIAVLKQKSVILGNSISFTLL